MCTKGLEVYFLPKPQLTKAQSQEPGDWNLLSTLHISGPVQSCSHALASGGLPEVHRGTDSQVHCNTLPTCCASSGSHHPRGCETEGEQQAQHYGAHECGSTAALRPFLPCQTASPAAALICHFQSLPSHVMKRRGMGSGRRLVVEGGGSIYM